MKLTPEQKLIEAANMDGQNINWDMDTEMFYVLNDRTRTTIKYPQYDSSYDAIIPLIQKQINQEGMILCNDFLIALRETCNAREKAITGLSKMSHESSLFFYCLTASPSQLLDALLSTKGFEV